VDWRTVFLQATIWFFAGLCLLLLVRKLFRVVVKRISSLIALLVIIAILLALIPRISFGPGGSGSGPVKGNGGGTGGAPGSNPGATLAAHETAVEVRSDHRGGYEVWIGTRGKSGGAPIALANRPSFRRELLDRLIRRRRELGSPERSPRPVAQLVIPHSFSATGRTAIEELLSVAGFVVRGEQF
jgi:hypothetical protein